MNTVRTDLPPSEQPPPSHSTMTLLSLLYWIILILGAISAFVGPTWPFYLHFLVVIPLFIIIGLRVFRMPIQ